MSLLVLASATCLTLDPAAQSRPGTQLPPLPLPQLDERVRSPDLDTRRVNLTFTQPVPIRELLLLLVRGTELSLVPGPDVGGAFIGELRSVTVRQGLELSLRPLGLDYSVDGRFVRVFRTEVDTRLFDVNYLSSSRAGTTSVGGADEGTGQVRVESTTAGDLFADLERGVRMLVSDRGLVHLDRKAGLLQVTDIPDRLDRVGVYLETVHERVHRQVQIEARVIEIELADPDASLDWSLLGGVVGAGTVMPRVPSRSGLRVDNAAEFLAALSRQGRVTVLASPRLLALNNELAIVRAFSSERSGSGRSAGQAQAVTLGVVPQIAADGVVMLGISPIVTVPDAESGGPATARATRATDTIARVAAGETVVVAGFGRHRLVREPRSRGWFRRPAEVTRPVELLILLTPTIVGPPGAG